eukprot:ANDGO_02129.mRNA.1 hypothetical protein
MKGHPNFSSNSSMKGRCDEDVIEDEVEIAELSNPRAKFPAFGLQDPPALAPHQSNARNHNVNNNSHGTGPGRHSVPRGHSGPSSAQTKTTPNVPAEEVDEIMEDLEFGSIGKAFHVRGASSFSGSRFATEGNDEEEDAIRFEKNRRHRIAKPSAVMLAMDVPVDSATSAKSAVPKRAAPPGSRLPVNKRRSRGDPVSGLVFSDHVD